MKVKRRKKHASFTNLDLSQILQQQKLVELIKWKEGFEMKLQALESPDSDEQAKSYTKTKVGLGIAIRKITDLIREKK